MEHFQWKAVPINDELLIKSIIDQLEDGVYVLDPERRIIYWNYAAEKITGYKAEEIVGRYCHDNLLNHMDKLGQLLCLMGCPMDGTLVDGEKRQAEVMLRHKDGYRIAVRAKTVPLIQCGEVIAAVQIFTKRSSIADGYGELLDVLSEKTVTDTLTGLKNRNFIQSFLEHKLKEYHRFHRKFCVLFMDIDNFSVFNNTYGHHIGDVMLKAIASSFKNHLRGSDIMGRWGGEEFLGVFTIVDPNDALTLAEKVRALVAGSEISHEGCTISVTCSVGAAIVKEGDTLDDIIMRADACMYQSKVQGKNRVSMEGVQNNEAENDKEGI